MGLLRSITNLVSTIILKKDNYLSTPGKKKVKTSIFYYALISNTTYFLKFFFLFKLLKLLAILKLRTDIIFRTGNVRNASSVITFLQYHKTKTIKNDKALKSNKMIVST